MSGGTQSEGASNSVSPASSVTLSNQGSSQAINNNAPKYGTLVPNRIFVGGISSNTTEAELCQLFSKYGNVKATKIIADRAGVSKGYGFVTFESEEEVKYLVEDANNIVLKERRLNIAPAIKKQPFSRSFEASTPPPVAQNSQWYFANGVPYAFHNGMAFFPPAAHQPLAALPSSADPSVYQTYGPTQNPGPPPYGAPVLVPQPPPVFMPQNYSYQPLPMTNGAPTQFIYPGSGSSNGTAGSPMAPPGTPENPHLPPAMAPQFYPQHFAPQEAFFHPPFYISYQFTSSGEYEPQEHHIQNEVSSSSSTGSTVSTSTVSTPHSDLSERSSNTSPATNMVQIRNHMVTIQSHQMLEKTAVVNVGKEKDMKQQSANNQDSQVPVVSWQIMNKHSEERQLMINNGRREFLPCPRPPPPPPQMMFYQQSSYPTNNMYPQSYHNNMYNRSQEGQRQQNTRGRPNSLNTPPPNNIPYIPKFPACFNNNNPLATNYNSYDKNSTKDRPNKYSNSKDGMGRSSRFNQPIHRANNPNPSFSNPSSSPSPQVMMSQSQHFERQYPAPMVNNTAPRWSNQQVNCQPMKRMVLTKRPQNGTSQNLGVNNNHNTNSIRIAKKPQGLAEGDIGGGGDAQPLTPPGSPTNNTDTTSKMQCLTIGSS